jgi:LuxR family maltose regulon positive regulatory protein
VLERKLHPPHRREDWVPRPELTRYLDSCHARLILVDAPAGYGKTTLLAQWQAASARARPFGWVSLDTGDNDPQRLWRHVACALRRALPGLDGTDLPGPAGGTGLPGLPEPPGGPDAGNAGPLLSRLANALAAAAEPVVLVLDDYHLITEQRCHQQLEWLLQQLSPPVSIALSTRADPPLPLGRLRVAGELAEIRMPGLRFTVAEAAALIEAAAGRRPGHRDLADLVQRAEGWPAGLYLAALSLRAEPDPAGFIRRFTGSNRFIADYLTEEVLARQPPEVREFLLRTSVLGRFTVPLCDAVTGAGDAAELIETLERQNLFVVPLDDQRQWFRYHHMFGQLLLSLLARAEPAAVPALHQRASDWFREHTDPAEAIEHALAAGNTVSAVELIGRHWYSFADAGRAPDVRRWLRALGDDGIGASPLAAHCAAWVAALAGERQTVSRWLPVIEAGGKQGPLPDGMRSLGSSAALLEATFGFTGLAPMRKAAARAVELENDPATPWYALARATLGTALYFSGEFTGAIRYLDEALASEPRMAHIRLLALAMRSLTALEQGRLGEARQAADTARELNTTPAAEPGDGPPGTLALIAAGAVRAAQGRPGEARSDLEHALGARSRWPGLSPWPTLEGLLRLAGTQLDQGDLAAAAAAIEQAGTLLTLLPDGARPQRERLARLARRLAADSAGGSLPEPLTEREQGVLRLLGGPLSLREIGRELSLSANTIKTHTRAIYRKLGVPGRQQAVARGRELGVFLPPAPLTTGESGGRRSQQLELPCPPDRLAPAGGAQLAEDAPQVGLDGVDGQVQLVGDLRGAEHPGRALEHLPFPLAEPVDDDRVRPAVTRRRREPRAAGGPARSALARPEQARERTS